MPEQLPVDAEVVCPDFRLPTMAHRYLPFGAARRLLEEGDARDFIMSREYAKEARKGIRKLIHEQQARKTPYQMTRIM